MNEASETKGAKAPRANWIAAGFIGAFAASIFTVIYTGLNVRGSSAEFDVGFRSVTLSVGEVREVDLMFESDAGYAEATLELTVPDAVRWRGAADAGQARRAVSIAPGTNTIPVEIEAVTPGSGYLAARLVADEPVGVYRVFVTVTAD